MSTLNVDKVDPSSGTALELGTSGDTITVPTGAGLTVVDEVKTNKISPATGTAFALGDSGDTFTVPSGATIANSGTATGFGNPVFIKQVTNTVSATTVSCTDCFSSTYDYYIAYIYAAIITANGDLIFNFLKSTSTDFTEEVIAGNLGGENGTTSPTAFDDGGVADSTTLKLASNDIYSGTGSGYWGQILIAHPYNRTDRRIHMFSDAVIDSSADCERNWGSWIYAGDEVADGFKLSSGSGSSRFGITEINVYGIE